MSLCAVAQDRDKLLNAIRQVESSGVDNPKDGDQGKAIGPYQIHREYWQDAIKYKPSIGGKYEDCRKLEYAQKIVKAYLEKHGPKNASDETLARIHNGGPKGHIRVSTVKYWQRVRKHLK